MAILILALLLSINLVYLSKFYIYLQILLLMLKLGTISHKVLTALWLLWSGHITAIAISHWP